MAGLGDGEDGDARAALRTLLHDLRTPLAVVVGFADLLARDAGALSASDRSEYLLRIQQGAHELRDVLDAAAHAARSAGSSGDEGK